MASFKKKLKIVYAKAANPPDLSEGVDKSTRFIPRSLEGGIGWGVFDQRENIFMSDREVKSTSIHELEHEPFKAN